MAARLRDKGLSLSRVLLPHEAKTLKWVAAQESMMTELEVISGEKRINSTNTSKRGYPIVERGATVNCTHCDGLHNADYRDSDVGIDIPAGHKRHSHYTCPETGKMFAAKKGSKLR